LIYLDRTTTILMQVEVFKKMLSILNVHYVNPVKQI